MMEQIVGILPEKCWEIGCRGVSFKNWRSRKDQKNSTYADIINQCPWAFSATGDDDLSMLLSLQIEGSSGFGKREIHAVHKI